MIANGLRAKISCVDPEQMPVAFAGRPFDEKLLTQLPEDVDPCGENGEFHTVVWDAPVFDVPLNVVLGEIVERDDFVFADVLLETR
jgi:diphthamide synthase (EF-2-diphthine--ammonia ligase)